MSEQLTSKELFVQARDLLRKIAGETDAARMEVNAWEAMELSRKMRAADELPQQASKEQLQLGPELQKIYTRLWIDCEAVLTGHEAAVLAAAVRKLNGLSDEPSDGRFEVYFRPSTGERGIIDDGAGGVKLTVDTSFFGSDQETLRYCSRIASLLNQVTNVPDGTSASGNARAIDERSDDGRIETTEVSTSEPPAASRFNAGDRVEWTNRLKERCMGVIFEVHTKEPSYVVKVTEHMFVVLMESELRPAETKADTTERRAAEPKPTGQKAVVTAPEPHVLKQIEHAMHDLPEQIGAELRDYITGAISDYRQSVTKDARCVWSKNCERPPREGSLLCDEHYGQAGETSACALGAATHYEMTKNGRKCPGCKGE